MPTTRSAVYKLFATTKAKGCAITGDKAKGVYRLPIELRYGLRYTSKFGLYIGLYDDFLNKIPIKSVGKFLLYLFIW